MSSGPIPDHPAKARRTSGTKDCSSIVPSAAAPSAIEDLEQERAQQLFRRDRGAPLARIELPKGSAQVFQNFPNQFTNVSQWMVLWHARLWRNIRKQSALIPKCPEHPGLQTIRDRN